MDALFVFFMLITIFFLCVLCGCCSKSEEQPAFQTPVVVTSTTYQPPGSNHTIIQNTSRTNDTSQQLPYPIQQQMPMPYPTNIPYNPMQQQPSAPYPPVAPYPQMQAPPAMDPPSYVEAMEQFQKQPSSKPNNGGN
ncbi:hypothetical protein PVAND_002089 [Polypedilum vanderplanki]|uniref:Uncharacterized protein n=1 Tax=Polypedilum vanderplanki TaxID=319348 RepID=A0A9J6BPW7_POLVA|nr:hypothetical protein PVAND_002089 [Polypedilum vanderplanki]